MKSCWPHAELHLKAIQVQRNIYIFITQSGISGGKTVSKQLLKPSEPHSVKGPTSLHQSVLWVKANLNKVQHQFAFSSYQKNWYFPPTSSKLERQTFDCQLPPLPSNAALMLERRCQGTEIGLKSNHSLLGLQHQSALAPCSHLLTASNGMLLGGCPSPALFNLSGSALALPAPFALVLSHLPSGLTCSPTPDCTQNSPFSSIQPQPVPSWSQVTSALPADIQVHSTSQTPSCSPALEDLQKEHKHKVTTCSVLLKCYLQN